MARIEEIERRLLNWARCKMSSGGELGFASVSYGLEISGGTRCREARIPMSDVEAGETARAILTLVSELRRTIEVVYTDGGGESVHLAKLCCSRTTLKARIDRSHVLLDRYFVDLQRLQTQERERIERLRAGTGRA